MSSRMTEAEAYRLLETIRWGDKPVCPHCGAGRPYYLNPANGVSRRTSRGVQSERRIWKCRACREQFTALTGTPFHRTKIPVAKLLGSWSDIYDRSLSTRQVARKHDLTALTVSRVRKRLGIVRAGHSAKPLANPR